MAKDHLHVVLIPYPAFGHITPFFHLSIALAKAGVHSHLVSTTRNIQRLPILPPDVAGMVNLVSLQRPPIDPTLLPEDAEATVDITLDKIQYLNMAFDLLKVPFQEFLSKLTSSSPPSWIISDLMSPSWLFDVSHMHNIPVVTFYVFSAASSVFFGPPEELHGKGIRHTPESLTTKPPWVEFPSTVAFRKFGAAFMYYWFHEKDASGISIRDRLGAITGSKALAIRSCPEFENDYFNLFEKITGKPVIPIGFLPTDKSAKGIVGNITDQSWKETFKWLDEQKQRSVVFVGFGSELRLTKDQVHTIAGGLELSGVPFLWALRKPTWADDDGTEDVLPPGFTTRTAGRGVMQIGWAPQKEILSHPSIGGSLSHGGWGSVIETLQHGHCLVLLPFINDQGLNAKLLVDKGLAIEAGIRDEDDSFSQQDIAKALIHAMVSVEGEALRANAKEAASIFGNQKLNDGYIESFVEYLKNENTCTI